MYFMVWPYLKSGMMDESLGEDHCGRRNICSLTSSPLYFSNLCKRYCLTPLKHRLANSDFYRHLIS